LKLTITGKGLSLTEALETYTRKRLARLDRRLNKSIPVRVILRHEETRSLDSRFVAEVTAVLNGGIIVRGEERAANINAAIDGVSDAVVRQIDRFKSRRIKSKRTGRGLAEFEQEVVTSAQVTPVATETGSKPARAEAVVRTKRHPVVPTTVEQAAEQMELLGHSFYVFLNVDNDAINVVYRRNDGAYGLIVPDRLGA